MKQKPKCVCGHNWGTHDSDGCRVIIDEGPRDRLTGKYLQARWCDCTGYNARESA